MKKQILISLILLSSILTINAQWNGTNPLSTSANVGIGTTNITAPLTVQSALGASAIRIIGRADDYGYLEFLRNNGTTVSSAIYSKTDRLTLTDATGNEVLNLKGGNVGIGTISPIAKLHVVDNTDNAGFSIQQSGNANNAAAGIYGQYYGLSVGIGNASQTYYAFNVSGNVTPIGNGFTGGNSLFVVKGDGNTGIGVFNPLSKLHIKTTFSSALRIERSGSNIFGFEIGGTTFGLYDYSNLRYRWRTDADNLLLVESAGSVGIGTLTPDSRYKLDVFGTIRAREIKVDLNGADFVFENDYKLMPLMDLEKFVKEQKHLPEIASATEMKENGTDLGNLNSKLLQKIEEMTLYMIEQNKKIQALEEKIEKLGPASK